MSVDLGKHAQDLSRIGRLRRRNRRRLDRTHIRYWICCRVGHSLVVKCAIAGGVKMVRSMNGEISQQ